MEFMQHCYNFRLAIRLHTLKTWHNIARSFATCRHFFSESLHSLLVFRTTGETLQFSRTPRTIELIIPWRSGVSELIIIVVMMGSCNRATLWVLGGDLNLIEVDSEYWINESAQNILLICNLGSRGWLLSADLQTLVCINSSNPPVLTDSWGEIGSAESRKRGRHIPWIYNSRIIKSVILTYLSVFSAPI